MSDDAGNGGNKTDLVEKKCNSYKIIAKTLVRSCKICLHLAKILQETHHCCKIFAKLKKKYILQSIQNQAFRVGSENDKNCQKFELSVFCYYIICYK